MSDLDQRERNRAAHNYHSLITYSRRNYCVIDECDVSLYPCLRRRRSPERRGVFVSTPAAIRDRSGR